MSCNEACSDGAATACRCSDGEVDDVIATLPVYFVPALTAQTHVFQFPLRTPDRAYEMRDATLLCTRGMTDGGGGGSSGNNGSDNTADALPDAHARAKEGVIGVTSRLTLHCTLDKFGSTSFAPRSDGGGGSSNNNNNMSSGHGTATLPFDLHTASVRSPPPPPPQQQHAASRSTTYSYRLHAQPFRARSDYLVGYVGSGGLHLTPVATVQQWSPLLRQHVSDDAESTKGDEQTAAALSSSNHGSQRRRAGVTSSGHDGSASNGSHRHDTATWTAATTTITTAAAAASAAAAMASRVPAAFCSMQTSPYIAGLPGTDRVQRELLRCRSTMLNRDADTAYAMLVFDVHAIESRALRRRLASTTREQARLLPYNVHAHDDAARYADAVSSPSPSSRSSHAPLPHRELPQVATNAAYRAEVAMDSHFPPEIVVSGGIAGGEEAAEATILRRFATRHTVAQQVQQLMERCQVLPLQTIVEHVALPASSHTTATTPTGVSPRERVEAHVISALRTCAMPMHGVWVSCSCSRFVGIAAALREVVLLRFYESDDASVTRAQVNAVAPSSALRRVALDILRSVATLYEVSSSSPSASCAAVAASADAVGAAVVATGARPRRWRLRGVHATSATARAVAEREWQERYPAIAALFRDAWARRVQSIVTHIPYLRARRAPPRLFLLACATSASCAAAAAAAGMASAIGGGGSCGNASPHATASPHSSSPPPPPPHQQQQQQQQQQQHNERALAPVRAYIRGLFVEHGVLNKQRAKELVLRGREGNYPDATNAMLATALQSCVRTFTPSTWVLQELGEPAVDRYRAVILDIVRKLHTFTARTVQTRLAAALRARDDDDDVVDDSDKHIVADDCGREADEASTRGGGSADAAMMRAVQRVLAEVAEYKMGERLWHLKSGNAMQPLL